MSFHSPAFIIFFILIVPICFVVPKKWQNVVLLIGSYVFYGFYDPKLMLLLLSVTASSYCFAYLIDQDRKHKTVWTIIGVSVPIGLLAVFKCVIPFLNALSDLFRGFDLFVDVILPAGISFYAFQAASYVIDVSRGETAHEKNPIVFALYLSFFPQLVAGPIERAKNLLPQIRSYRSFDPDKAVSGCKTMLLGFIEKIAIADVLGIYVNRVYESIHEASGLEAFIASLLFSVQILCDFKGYSDIAVGTAKVLGISLSQNFDRPYSAYSVNDFWKRWHISLSSWFRDYLYIPLGGNRKGDLIWIRNLLIVFGISGLWHGTGITFLLWGLAHAVFQIAEHFLFLNKKPSYVRKGMTFLAVNFAWALFRSGSLSVAGTFFARLLFGWDSLFTTHFGVVETVFLIAALLLYAVIAFTNDRISKTKSVRYAFFAVAVVVTISAYIMLRSNGIHSNFIYFRF